GHEAGAARRIEPRVLVHEGDQACTRAARRPAGEPRREIRAPYLDHIGLLARHDVAELPPRHQEVIARARGYGGTAHQVHARALPLRHGCLVRGNHDHVLDVVPGRQPARLRSEVGAHPATERRVELGDVEQLHTATASARSTRRPPAAMSRSYCSASARRIGPWPTITSLKRSPWRASTCIAWAR